MIFVANNEADMGIYHRWMYAQVGYLWAAMSDNKAEAGS